MSKVKDAYYTIAEQAFKLEISRGQNREAQLNAWSDLLNKNYELYGAEAVTLAWDIYDEIADGTGDYWDLFAEGLTYNELKEIYSEANNA